MSHWNSRTRSSAAHKGEPAQQSARRGTSPGAPDVPASLGLCEPVSQRKLGRPWQFSVAARWFTPNIGARGAERGGSFPAGATERSHRPRPHAAPACPPFQLGACSQSPVAHADAALGHPAWRDALPLLVGRVFDRIQAAGALAVGETEDRSLKDCLMDVDRLRA